MDTMKYLYSLQHFGIKLGLDRIEEVCTKLGNPWYKFKSIHIAGTNGKGSTCAMLSSILGRNHKVGMYTSPHLVDYKERIQVNGVNISDLELTEIVSEICKVLDYENLEITFFEITTLIAFMHFARKKVDYAVIEVGLGGRLDATNVITPIISVITNISLDHTNILGDTLEKIAYEKAGIIKSNGIVVLGEDNKVIRDVCFEKGSKVYLAEARDYKLGMLGKHQNKNAAVAVKVANLLGISEEDVKQGLLDAQWVGRLQWVNSKLLVDGAHNVAGMECLVSYLKTVSPRDVLLLGFSEGKEIAKMVAMIAPLFPYIIITKSSFKPAQTQFIAEFAQEYCSQVEVVTSVADALVRARSIRKNGALVCAGSLYLIGDVLKLHNA